MTILVRLVDPITEVELAREVVPSLRVAMQGPAGPPGAAGEAGPEGPEGPEGPQGPPGDPGGPPGPSAYDVAVAAGFVGTEVEWLASLVGPPGADGADGADGAAGGPGADGADGASAYELAVASGFVGTLEAWLASLVGPAGADGSDGAPGADGADGAPGADGADGASAYEVAVAGGFVGTAEEWLASLTGPAGADGVDGVDGAAGTDGADGADGAIPTVGSLITGRFYACGGIGIGAGTINVTGASGRVDLAPRVRRRSFGPLAGIGTMIQSGGGGGALVRIVFYLPDADGWPDTILWQSASLDASVFAFREVTSGLPDLDAHELLWYGIAHEGSATTQVRSHNISDTIEIGGWAPGATPSPNPGTVIRRTGVSLASLPNPWVFNAAELTALVNPPLIYLRV